MIDILSYSRLSKGTKPCRRLTPQNIFSETSGFCKEFPEITAYVLVKTTPLLGSAGKVSQDYVLLPQMCKNKQLKGNPSSILHFFPLLQITPLHPIKFSVLSPANKLRHGYCVFSFPIKACYEAPGRCSEADQVPAQHHVQGSVPPPRAPEHRKHCKRTTACPNLSPPLRATL